jgi:predicted nicotinamide N-methyase
MALAANNYLRYHSHNDLLVPQTSGIPVLSFFTGAGFLDIGFLKAGFNTIWSNEYDPFFVKGFDNI